MTLTQTELDAMRERVNAAAPGPWLASENARRFWQIAPALWPPVAVVPLVHDQGGYHVGRDDAEFIAAARADVPRLLDEVDRLKKALRFYADRDHWVSKLPDGRVAHVHRLSSSTIDDDHGRLAQETLDG